MTAVAMADHPGLKITVQGTPWPDYWSKIGNQLSNTGAPCIVGMQSLRLAAYGDQLVPMDELMAKYGVKAEDFDKSIIDGDEARRQAGGPAVRLRTPDRLLQPRPVQGGQRCRAEAGLDARRTSRRPRRR